MDESRLMQPILWTSQLRLAGERRHDVGFLEAAKPSRRSDQIADHSGDFSSLQESRVRTINIEQYFHFKLEAPFHPQARLSGYLAHVAPERMADFSR
jgi:hypothetical protein